MTKKLLSELTRQFTTAEITEEICTLAFLALEDAAALEPLGDSVLRHHWYDNRMARFNYLGSERETIATEPTSRWARAIIAVIWFPTWSEDMWPLCVENVEKQNLSPYRRRSHVSGDAEWAAYGAEWAAYGSFADFAANDGEGFGNEPSNAAMQTAWRERQMVRQRERILQPNAPATRIRTYILPFNRAIVKAGEWLYFEARAQVNFRGQRLIISSTICDALEVTSFQVANQNFVIGAGAVPGRMFSEEANAIMLTLPTANPAMTIRLHIQNISSRDIEVRPVLVGIGIDD